MNKMFEHSVRVPRHFKIAANIFKKVSTEGGSIKSLLYDEKLRHFRTNVLYALLTETIKHASHIDKIFETCGILVNEPRLDPWLAKVLTAELLFGKKCLPGKSKPEQTILSYKEQFEKYSTEHQDESTSKVISRPRYVRINTNLLTTSDAIRAFQDEGYKFIRCTSGSYNDYLQQIHSLTEYDFTQDYHIKTIFVFAPGTKFHEHDLYLENQIILQDKATALAVHLLAPPPGSVILDMCAAPGMKTTQLAAYLKNQGKIYAVERNEQRYQTLCDFVGKTGSKCVETLHKDSLEIKRGDYDDVEYIILDPSCSGSGMQFSVHNYVEDVRLAKLTSLQEKFLKHAMNSFPNAKRIVYCTCSLFHEENERVVTNIVKASRAKWRVQDVKELLKGQWNNVGSGMYGSMGTRCLYAKPDSDYTSGFFLAVLDRESKDQSQNSNIVNGHHKNINVNNAVNSELIRNNENECNQDDIKTKLTKKFKKESKNITLIEDIGGAIKKEKKKNKISEANDGKIITVGNVQDNEKPDLHFIKNELKTENDVDLYDNNDEQKSSKKKKKKDKIRDNIEPDLHLIKNELKTENDIDLFDEEKSSKKRKTKDNVRDNGVPDLHLIKNELKTENDVGLNDDNHEQKLTKKRNKKDKIQDLNYKESILVDNEHELTKKKKKKSKEIHSNNEETISNAPIVKDENDIINLVQEDQKLTKKKKKKDKVRDSNNKESFLNLHTVQNENDIVNLADDDLKLSKIKRETPKVRDLIDEPISNLSILEDEHENDLINLVEDDQKLSKKKKKKDKVRDLNNGKSISDLNITEYDGNGDITIVIEDETLSNKKKKKRKISENEYLEIENSNVEPIVNKTKKIKKYDENREIEKETNVHKKAEKNLNRLMSAK